MLRYPSCVAVVGLMAISSLMVGAGCERKSPGQRFPPLSPTLLGKTAVAEFDADKDGKIDEEELKKCPALKMYVSRINPNGDGSITAGQIAARIKEMRRTETHLMAQPVRVVHNGKPLDGATVRLVPEKFMDDKSPICTGTVHVGAQGLANPSKPIGKFPDDLPGVPPGFYRIEITKDGEEVPAKYNAESIYGVEVAPDIKGRELSIDVVY